MVFVDAETRARAAAHPVGERSSSRASSGPISTPDSRHERPEAEADRAAGGRRGTRRLAAGAGPCCGPGSRTDDFASAARLTQQVGEAAEAANHHPDLDLRWGRLDVALASHDVGGITSRDLDLARAVSALAAEEGARPDTASLQVLEVAIDTSDEAGIGPLLGRACSAARLDGRRGAAAAHRRRPHAVVPGHRRPRRAAAALPPRRVGAARAGPAPDRRGARGRRHPGQRRRGARRSGCWPTPTATRPASARGRTAADRASLRQRAIARPGPA